MYHWHFWPITHVCGLQLAVWMGENGSEVKHHWGPTTVNLILLGCVFLSYLHCKTHTFVQDWKYKAPYFFVVDKQLIHQSVEYYKTLKTSTFEGDILCSLLLRNVVWLAKSCQVTLKLVNSASKVCSKHSVGALGTILLFAKIVHTVFSFIKTKHTPEQDCTFQAFSKFCRSKW